MNSLQKPQENYTVIDNRIHDMTQLTLGARYLWIYLFGRPDNWQVKTSQLQTVLGYKAQTIRKFYNELIDANLLTVERKNTGHCVYRLHGITTGENITRENVTREKVTPIVSTERAVSTEKKPFDQTAFDHWWNLYPKKVGKKQALAAWKKLKPDTYLVSTIVTDTIRRKEQDRKWIDGFVKDPVRYIKHEQWTDEMDTSAPKTTALPNDMEGLSRVAVERGLHAPGQAPGNIRNAFEYKSWIQERI